jgi:hypothetical protein
LLGVFRMGFRVAIVASVLVLSACEAVTVEGASPAESVTARTCLGSVAASLDLDRKTLTATAVQSLPEGDMVSIATADGQVRCYTDLTGKVVSIQHAPAPPAA